MERRMTYGVLGQARSQRRFQKYRIWESKHFRWQLASYRTLLHRHIRQDIHGSPEEVWIRYLHTSVLSEAKIQTKRKAHPMTYREVPDTLQEAKKEIARLQEMLTKARVVRVEVDEPELVDGKWRMYPIITCIGMDEKEFAEEAGQMMAACFVHTLMAA